jgi:hypothetical protein
MTGSARSTKWVLTLAVALGLAMGAASAAIPARPNAAPAQIAEAKRVLEADGYTGIAVVGGNDRLITASAVKDGRKSLVDVDPMTRIILPHVDLPPVPAQLAPATELSSRR